MSSLPALAARMAVSVICVGISCAPPDTQRIPATGSAPASQSGGGPAPVSAQQASPAKVSIPLPPGYSLTDTAEWGNPVENGDRAILRRGNEVIDTVALEFEVVTVGKDSLIFLAVRHHTELFIPGDSSSGYESFPTEYIFWTPSSRRELRGFLPFFKSDNSSPIVSDESVIHYWGIATPAPEFRVYAMRYDFRTTRVDSLFTHVDDLASDYRYYLPVPRVSDTAVSFGGLRLDKTTWKAIGRDPPPG